MPLPRTILQQFIAAETEAPHGFDSQLPIITGSIFNSFHRLLTVECNSSFFTLYRNLEIAASSACRYLRNMYAFINDRLVPIGEAFLPVSDLALNRGYGVFDFFRTSNGIPFQLVDHLQRFYRSAEYMHLEPPCEMAELENHIMSLIRRNGLPSSGVRITLTGGNSADGYQPGKPNLLITEKPFSIPAEAAFEPGLYLRTTEYARQFPEVKTIDYMMAVWMQPELAKAGADEVLYCKNGSVSECPRANIFLLTQDDQLVTPASGMLSGITRKKILENSNWQVVQRPVGMQDLAEAKEVFITSTTRLAWPVRQIDGLVLPQVNVRAKEIREFLGEA